MIEWEFWNVYCEVNPVAINEPSYPEGYLQISSGFAIS